MIHSSIRRVVVLLIGMIVGLAYAQTDVVSPHGPLKWDCQVCHVTTDWTTAPTSSQFDHAQTSFPLSGRHLSVRCRECHKTLEFKSAAMQCTGCHKDVHNAQFAYTCDRCHTTSGWTNISEMYQRHSQTRFPLTGVHSSLDCEACHLTGQFAALSTDCRSCHAKVYEETTNPSHVSAGFSTNCADCHNTTASKWTASFNHPAAFPLTGGHAVSSCAVCHRGNYRQTSALCYSCHSADFQNAQNPNHTGYPQTCETCHTTVHWQPATFNHNLTAFPLTGAHVTLDCGRCHTNGQFAGTSTDCYSCHTTAYQQATSPNHAAGQLSHNCQDCHTTGAWQPSTFNHSSTRFPLTGNHTQQTCQACHINGNFANTPTDCFACHSTAYQQATNPDHVAGQLDHNCAICHTTNAWQPAVFDHNQTTFPLTGQHALIACQLCHLNGQFVGTPTACYSCHQTNYQNATNPDHVAGQFDHNCGMCHSTSAWQPSTFDHSQTVFPLTGAHVTTACQLCHVNGHFAGTPTDCYSCHQAAFQGVTDPNHVTLQFSHLCATCHSTSAWNPATFDHSTTAFPLTGVHATTSCGLCHVNGQFQGTPTACYSCHQTNYQSATNPDHVAGQFDHNCAMCHSTSAWQPSTFDHNQTVFPLTGAHVTTACQLCHVNGHFAGTPTDCYSCHQAAFQGVTDPNHVTLQFSHLCATCHSTTAWNPATFDHSTTAFPLTGAHVNVACGLCHVNGQFAGTPTDCYFCHETNYNATTNPNHQAAHFPTTCASCHTTFDWTATFNHDGPYFPIYSGRHQSVWTQCSDCHTNPNDYAVFSCIDCHSHLCPQMNNAHSEVSGYSCVSSECYRCHPRGTAGDLPGLRRRPTVSPREK